MPNFWAPRFGVLEKKSSSFVDVFFIIAVFFVFAGFCLQMVIERSNLREEEKGSGGAEEEQMYYIQLAQLVIVVALILAVWVLKSLQFSWKFTWFWFLLLFFGFLCFYVQAFSSPLHPLRSISSEETGLQKTETEKFTEIEIDKWHVASNLIWIQTKESKTKNDTQSTFQVTRILDSLPDHQNWER